MMSAWSMIRNSDWAEPSRAARARFVSSPPPLLESRGNTRLRATARRTLIVLIQLSRLFVIAGRQRRNWNLECVELCGPGARTPQQPRATLDWRHHHVAGCVSTEPVPSPSCKGEKPLAFVEKFRPVWDESPRRGAAAELRPPRFIG